MIIIDSSGWLEYFIAGPNSKFFAAPIKNNTKIIVPTIVIYELWKKISREKGENKAIEVVAQLKRYEIVPLDESLSISAANIKLHWPTVLFMQRRKNTMRHYGHKIRILKILKTLNI